ncbi:MAG: isochorismatase family protein [Bacteroidales bacterium]|nr:isochorismatase family protein [Bacteroidales bacterium]
MIQKKRKIKKIIYGILGTIILMIAIVIVDLIIVSKNGSVISKGQPIESNSKTNYALLVIDIQEATTGDVSIYPFFKKHSDDLIRNINQIADSFRMQHLPVVYIRSEITNPIVNLINNAYAKGKPGAQFDKRLKAVSQLEVVKKYKDSFRKTNLDSILTEYKVNELYIVGLDAAECVNGTIEAAQKRNYRVNLIEEAILSKTVERKDSMMASFKERGVRVIPIDSLNIKLNVM